MKKDLFVLIVNFISAVSLAYGQEYPKGIYMSLDEIVSRAPSLQIELTLVKRTNGDIKMNGGNDYKLSSEDKKIKKSFLKNDIWAYSEGDTLYMNGLRLHARTWYAKLLDDGKYMVFRAGLSNLGDVVKKQQQAEDAMGYMFGAIGGGLAGAERAMLRFLYVLEKETGKVTAIDRETLKTLLAPCSELLNSYDKEPNPDAEETQIKYLKLLNRALE